MILDDFVVSKMDEVADVIGYLRLDKHDVPPSSPTLQELAITVLSLDGTYLESVLREESLNP